VLIENLREVAANCRKISQIFSSAGVPLAFRRAGDAYDVER
jgi:hypothetical protein